MKSVRRLIFVILSLFCISSIMHAQDIDEIIAKHIDAHGDTDKWDAIQSMEIRGRFIAFSEEDDFYALKTNSGAYYSELHLGKHKVTEAFNGTSGWTIDPWHDFSFPRALNKTEVNVFYQKAEFFTPFYKWKERGFNVKLLGKQTVDGIDVFVIKLSRPNGKSETWFLDANTYLEYKCESEWADFGYGGPAESYFDDFRTVDGMIIPFFVERTFYQRNRMLQIEDITFNIELDEELFEFPRSNEMKKLAFLAGTWDVKVDVWTRRGSWYRIDSTISIVEWESTNRLLEKIIYDRIYVHSKWINYSYSSSGKKYKIIVYNGFPSDFELFEGGFNDSTFVADQVFINGEDSTQQNAYSRIILRDREVDSFVFEVETTRDAGANWRPQDKFSYIRRKEVF